MRRFVLSLPLAAALLAALQLGAAEDGLTGEGGQAVSGCRCKGPQHTHGECGFHIHFGSNEDKPWCRTVHGCGRSGLKGGWTHCDARSVARRYANDGQLYTSKEFQAHYKKDSAASWNAAKNFAERRVAKDGWAYSISDFRAHYVDSWGEQGWLDLWEAATVEKRKAADGKWYTFSEFLKNDPSEGWEQWAKAAGSSGVEASTSKPDGCQCLGKGATHGHCGFHINFGSSADTPWCRTAVGCGEKSIRGSWANCSPDAVERRRLSDGQLRTVKDLEKTNPKDGAKVWGAAKQFVERKMDGHWLGGQKQFGSVHEFREFYLEAEGEKGWLLVWQTSGAEQRKAKDSKWYSWEGFAQYYGEKAMSTWELAPDHDRRSDNGEL